MTTGKANAVFIDKDGTLIPDIPYNANADLITLESGAVEGLQLLQQHHFLLIVVSNQAGVALGYFEEAALKGVQAKLEELLREHGIVLDGFYYCPHHPHGVLKKFAVDCDCRKPAPGLLLRAAQDFTIDLSRSWMIGDILNDVEAGNKAGCKTVLLDNGNETEWLLTEERTPTCTAKRLDDAAAYIISHSEQPAKTGHERLV